MDIARSLTDAGGVEALVQIVDHASQKSFFPAWDGNGNVVGLVNGDTGALAAVYEYDPYGQALRADNIDAVVADQPWRFSTKWWDKETGLAYYGHRYYSPGIGRFINRDPIEEAGGVNLYAFCSNNSINLWDVLGHNGPTVAQFNQAVHDHPGWVFSGDPFTPGPGHLANSPFGFGQSTGSAGEDMNMYNEGSTDDILGQTISGPSSSQGGSAGFAIDLTSNPTASAAIDTATIPSVSDIASAAAESDYLAAGGISYGERFSAGSLGNWVKEAMKAAGIERPGSCHLFRHSCATHMLENGADIRFIQQLLGHARLDTTQIYTEVTIHQLREVHARTHPHGRRAAAAAPEAGLPPAANAACLRP